MKEHFTITFMYLNKSCNIPTIILYHFRVMWFKPRRCRHQFLEQPDIMVYDMILQVTAKQKYYLGLIFDNQLTLSGMYLTYVKRCHIIVV